MQLISDLPLLLQPIITQYWEAYHDACERHDCPLLSDETLLAQLQGVWACSDFVAKSCIKTPKMLDDLVSTGDLGRIYPDGYYLQFLNNTRDRVFNDRDLKLVLRQFRRREMVRIAWRDLANIADLDETLADLSSLAEACLEYALDRLDEWHQEVWGVPMSVNGERQKLVVLGMGKLGARELNFSSDIDLIFAYPEDGETQGGRSAYNEEYFVRLCQLLVQVINTIDGDGFVFRVDVRLRPYGDSGPLAMSFDAMEDYYQSQGREWERYAMVKARPVAGDISSGYELLGMLKPFVYRRYLDYSAFESLREMKAMISREIKRKGIAENIKTGPGGIREIEFIGQAFQLIRGGREPELQQRQIMNILELLGLKQYLPEDVVALLRENYAYLRLVENRIQAYLDQQLHSLPTDEIGHVRMAFAMNCDHWETFYITLNQHRTHVQQQFEAIFSENDTDRDVVADKFQYFWKDEWPDEQRIELFSEQGYEDVRQSLLHLDHFKNSSAVRALSQKGRNRLDKLMPLVLASLEKIDNKDVTLKRLLQLLEKIVRRTSYLVMLYEHPMTVELLTRLTAVSPWIVDLLSRYPLLLDELLDPEKLFKPPEKKHLNQELSLLSQPISLLDQELVMDLLRQFAQTNMLRVAAADVTRVLPVEKVSDRLSEIAETVLDKVLKIARLQMTAKYGEPRYVTAQESRTAGFVIIAYGKLGGIELGYSSDLDLVFLHGSCGAQQMTEGENSIDNSIYFVRMGQRIIHILTTQTHSGKVYEVDMRLRPSGASGMLVGDFDAFQEYQLDTAWTWEHQALVRARPVAGDPELIIRFELFRKQILCQPRDATKLREDVQQMREKMRAELATKKERVFDIKQHRGGIADIEFMVQYAVLRWSHEYPDVAIYTDNHRILEALSQHHILSRETAMMLDDAYRQYRNTLHHHALQSLPGYVPQTQFTDLRENVSQIWQEFMA